MKYIQQTNTKQQQQRQNKWKARINSWSISVLLHGQEKFELWGKFLLGVQPVGKIDPPNPAVLVQLHPERFDVVSPVSPTGEVTQVKLDLIPALIEPHGHGTNERFDPGRGLIVGLPETSPHVFIIEHLNLEGEVFLQVLDNHNQEGEFYAQGLGLVLRTTDIIRGDVSAHNF